MIDEGGRTRVAAVGLADGPWTRLRGLIGRPLPGPGEGLWLTRCASVHTVGMRGPIDVVFLGRDGEVLDVAERLAPFRFAAARRARATLELAAGESRRVDITPGTRLAWTDDPTD